MRMDRVEQDWLRRKFLLTKLSYTRFVALQERNTFKLVTPEQCSQPSRPTSGDGSAV